MNLTEAEQARVADIVAGSSPAPGPSTMGEVWQSEWKRSGLDTAFGVGAPMNDAFEELRAGVAGVVGGDIATYAANRGILWQPNAPFTTRLNALNEIVDGLPEEQRKQLEPLKDVRKRATIEAGKTEMTAAEIRANTPGLSGATVAFVAGTVRQMADPIAIAANVATAPIGGPFTGRLVPMLLRQAGAGALGQAVVEPGVQQGRAELGLESGFGHAAINIAQAAGGAAALSALFRGAAFGIRAVRAAGEAPVAVRPPEGIIQPAAAAPAGEAPRPTTAALAGDVTPAAELARPEPVTAISRAGEGEATFGPEPMRARLEQPFSPFDLDAVARHVERDQVVAAAAHDRSPAGQIAHGEKVEAAAVTLEKGGGLPPDPPALVRAFTEPLPEAAVIPHEPAIAPAPAAAEAAIAGEAVPAGEAGPSFAGEAAAAAEGIKTVRKSTKPRGAAAKDPATFSLLQFLASKGGLKPDRGDWLHIFGGKNPFIPGFGPLIRKTGMAPDTAHRAAVEAGYLHLPQELFGGGYERAAAVQSALYDAVREEASGNKQYTLAHEAKLYREGRDPATLEARDQEITQFLYDFDNQVTERLRYAGKPIPEAGLGDELLGRMREIGLQQGGELADVKWPLVYERALMEDLQSERLTRAEFPETPVPEIARGAPGDGGPPARPVEGSERGGVGAPEGGPEGGAVRGVRELPGDASAAAAQERVERGQPVTLDELPLPPEAVAPLPPGEATRMLGELQQLGTKEALNFAVGVEAGIRLGGYETPEGLKFLGSRLAQLRAQAATAGAERVAVRQPDYTLRSILPEYDIRLLDRGKLEGPAADALRMAEAAFETEREFINAQGFEVQAVNPSVQRADLLQAKKTMMQLGGTASRMVRDYFRAARGEIDASRVEGSIAHIQELAATERAPARAAEVPAEVAGPSEMKLAEEAAREADRRVKLVDAILRADPVAARDLNEVEAAVNRTIAVAIERGTFPKAREDAIYAAARDAFLQGVATRKNKFDLHDQMELAVEKAAGAATEATPAGEQGLIPGVAPVTEKQRIEAAGARPMRGGDQPAGGMFGEGAKQMDIADVAARPSALAGMTDEQGERLWAALVKATAEAEPSAKAAKQVENARGYVEWTEHLVDKARRRGGDVAAAEAKLADAQRELVAAEAELDKIAAKGAELGTPPLQTEAQRVLDEAGGDLEVTLPTADGSGTRKVSARQALAEAAEDDKAAAELTACIGADEEIPF